MNVNFYVTPKFTKHNKTCTENHQVRCDSHRFNFIWVYSFFCEYLISFRCMIWYFKYYGVNPMFLLCMHRFVFQKRIQWNRVKYNIRFSYSEITHFTIQSVSKCICRLYRYNNVISWCVWIAKVTQNHFYTTAKQQYFYNRMNDCRDKKLVMEE